MPISIIDAKFADVRHANFPEAPHEEARERATDAAAAMSAEQWAQMVQTFMRSDAGKGVVEQLRQAAPAGWASFTRRFANAPDADARAAEAATQNMERLLLRTNPAGWQQFLGKVAQAKGMTESAIEQFANTESKLKQTASTPDKLAKWSTLTSKSGEDAANASMALKQSAEVMTSGAKSSDDIDVLHLGQTDMDSYQHVVQMYTLYYQDLTKALADTSHDVSAGGDANKLKINVDDMVKQLQGVVDRAKNQPPYQLAGAPDKNADPAAYKQWLDDWRTELGDTRDANGKPKGAVIVDDDGRVSINTDQVENMISSLTQMNGAGTKGNYSTGLEMDTAAYQAWQSGRDTQRSNVQSNVQTLLTKFQNRQSNFDNLCKLITNAISQMFDARKQFAQ